MRWVKFSFIPFLAIAIGLGGCSLGYLTRVGMTQAKILQSRVSLEKVETEGKLTPEQLEKIALIQEAKDFGESVLGLKKTKNYTLYAALKKDLRPYVLSACPKDSLTPYQWKFPIVGAVPYLGFFDKEEALEKEQELQHEGYDTFLRRTGAFSSLGWFRDPIYPHMLELESVRLVNLILHELVHATLYVKGETAFNESVATYIANEGTILFFERAEDPISKGKAFEHAQEALMFGRFLGELYETLQDFYGQSSSQDEKMEERVEIFERFRHRLQQVPFSLESPYRKFGEGEWNNARIIASGLYLKHLPLYYVLREQKGIPLEQSISYFEKFIHDHKDPWGALKSL
ncbi:MAG: aminopeptidase [Deltaproteobacteria bacterium]|nr:aminopeptidase [Deltaproteobacteria bacterium]